ncbi:caspase-8-like [Myxocyprinus asiaticus]|uniref:caspase-8-like n=1 Tax=Myxocyprinus asiaticus TaxID=70543 RepID=UPI0022219D3E|nr:caspase-8-like [Myxocyprinus asiaticus]
MGTKQDFCERILKNKVFLVETLCEEAELIMQHVQQVKLLTQREYRNLKDVRKREKMIIDLLDKLMSKGDETCCKFIDLLKQDSILETLPMLENHAIFASSAMAQDTSLKYPLQDSPELRQYKITQIPRGTCVIFNNVHFTSLKERMGSDEDQKSLEKVFSWLAFKVVVHRDKMAAEMRDLLKDLGKTVDGDCFICCVLSHGSKDGVYGTDGVVVSVDEIREPFNGINCQRLAGKPKVFFIQACRGNNNQTHVNVQADDPEGEESEIEVDTDGFEISIPADSDFLIARSSTDGHCSYRQSEKGSWFIQSLCQQLENHCPQGTDIQTILLCVNDEVSRQGSFCKQMPVQEVAMRKKLILPLPGAE